MRPLALPLRVPLPRTRLGRDILCLSLAKLAGLWLLYGLFFSPAHRAPIDPAGHLGPVPAGTDLPVSDVPLHPR